MSEQQKGLRGQMPKTAEMIDKWRAQWGLQHVKACVDAGIKGVPDQFYALEAGLVVGTPFTPTADGFEQMLKLAALTGGFFAVMREPKQGASGHGQNSTR